MGTTRAARSGAPALARYALAIILVALALLISLALRHSFGNPFWFFFSVAVILSTWLGRTGPGWFSVGCSTLAVMYYFTPPVHRFAVTSSDLPYFFTFVACEVGATQLISWRRRSDDALRQARDELEARVKERTLELKNANDALLKQMEEQRRTEETLQSTRADLARASRITTIGELTASIAHEVNQPLAAVVANADACVAWLSRETPDFPEARAAAERATEGATRASDVIARIRSLITKATPQKSRVEINRIIEQTTVLAEGQATKNNVEMKLELAPDLAISICFGTAALAHAAGFSVALGAFLAGVSISSLPELHDANSRLVPLRDAFVALFFVTLGTLIDPRVLFEHLPLLGGMLLLIVVGKLFVWTTVVWLFHYPLRTAITVAVGLTQIGELSFVVMQVARSSGLVDEGVFSAAIAASLISILLNVFLVRAVFAWTARDTGEAVTPTSCKCDETGNGDHIPALQEVQP